MTRMDKNKEYSYLEDGQTAPRISDWQERLSNSPEAVLSVLSDAMQAISPAQQTADYGSTLAALSGERDALLSLLSHTAEQIPLPKGFFVGDDERLPAYRIICRLLLTLEAHAQAFRTHVFALSATKAWLSKQKRNVDRVKPALWEIGQAAAALEQTPTQKALEEYRKALAKAEQAAAALLAKVNETEAYLQALLSSTLPTFCTRMHAAADMEHAGAACNPTAAVRLCGELLTALRTQVL